MPGWAGRAWFSLEAVPDLGLVCGFTLKPSQEKDERHEEDRGAKRRPKM